MENKKLTDKEKLEKLNKPMPVSIRDGRAGETYKFVSNANVVKRLNEVFGLSWNDEVIREIIKNNEVSVLVRLSYPLEDGTIGYKEAWGGKVLETKNKDGKVFRILEAEGLKSAQSLALVKAANKIGIKVLDDDSEISEATKEKILELCKYLGKDFDASRFDGLNEMQGQEIISYLEKEKKPA